MKSQRIGVIGADAREYFLKFLLARRLECDLRQPGPDAPAALRTIDKSPDVRDMTESFEVPNGLDTLETHDVLCLRADRNVKAPRSGKF
jgi:hypothetical protein